MPALNSNNICLTSAPYYASGSGVTTTTSAPFQAGTSGFVASCTSFMANEGVYIAGAGTYGTNYIGTIVSCSGTTLTVTPATSTTVASGALVQHDETAAFNAAIGAIAILPSPIGSIWLPDGYYRVNGPLLDPSGANAILPMPKTPNYSHPMMSVSVEGFQKPIWNTPAGAYILTSATTGNLIGGYDDASGGGYPPFTNVKLTLRNVAFLGPDNSNLVYVNATYLQALEAEHVFIGTSTSVKPTSAINGGGIYMPSILNEVQNRLVDVSVNGVATPFQLTEHTTADAISATNGIDCFVFNNGYNSTQPNTYRGNGISVGQLWTMHCTHGISAGVTTADVHIDVANLELPDTYGIYDPKSYLHGVINVLNPYGPDQCYTPVFGARNVALVYLHCAVLNGWQTQHPTSASYGALPPPHSVRGTTSTFPSGYIQNDANMTVQISVSSAQKAGRSVVGLSFSQPWSVAHSGVPDPGIPPNCQITAANHAASDIHWYILYDDSDLGFALGVGSTGLPVGTYLVNVKCSQ